jgi:hypothetical protein
MDEEPKLATSMKMYKDNANQATTHFPNRAAASIPSKWNRNFCPLFTRQPFTKEEDEAILHAFRTTTTTTTNNFDDGNHEEETELVSAAASVGIVVFFQKHCRHCPCQLSTSTCATRLQSMGGIGVPEDFVLHIDNEPLNANKHPL